MVVTVVMEMPMTDATVLRFRSRRTMEKELDVVRTVENHPELGYRAAVQLRRVYATGKQIFIGLTRAQVGTMRVIAARRNAFIPF